MDEAGIDATARQDTSVLACEPARLVVRTNYLSIKASRRVRIVLAVAGIVALPLINMLLWHLFMPAAPLLPAAVIGLGIGVVAASAFLVEMRLVAVEGGQGLFVERHDTLLRSRTRRLLIAYGELTGYDIRAESEKDSTPPGRVAYVLRLHAGDRRIAVWSTFAPDVAEAVGQRVMRLARAESPAHPAGEKAVTDGRG